MKNWKIIIEGLGPYEEETYMKYMICFIKGETLEEIMEKLDKCFHFHDNPIHYHCSIME